MKRFLYIIFSLLTIQACTGPYYGHSKEDWNKLTYQEREKIKGEYKSIIDSRQIQEHDNKIKARDQSIIDFANDDLYRK